MDGEFVVPLPAREAGKFSNPEFTAKGEKRAIVPLVSMQTLWFNTGTLCNIECENCYIFSSPTNDALVYLSIEDVTQYLDELDHLKEKTPKRWSPREIGFTGGEPFMNPAIIDILRETLSRGHKVLMLTNAMAPMMRPRMREGLLELQELYGEQLTMRISIDHYSKDLHDKERGEGAFEKTLIGMRWLSEHGFRLDVAGRTCWGEDEAHAREGYASLFAPGDFDGVLENFGQKTGRHHVRQLADDCAP